MPAELNHLFVAGFTDSQDFKSTLSVFKQSPPQRDRQTHGKFLLKQLGLLNQYATELEARRQGLELPQKVGMTIALEVSPAGALDYFRQLEWRRDGIEVLSATDAGGTEIVALHVPEGRLAAFAERVQEYLTKDVKARKAGAPDRPAFAALVNAIADFRKAAFEELWTDEAFDPPAPDKVEWFQVWLRLRPAGPASTREEFAAAAKKFGIEVEAGFVSFPGRVVVAVRSSRQSLEQALELLDLVAEIRAVAPTADFYLANLKPFEQADWVKDLNARCTYAGSESVPFVTLLDTGVNQGHPLLSPVLAPSDLHAVDATWGTSDHVGHGTEMAGIASHGDLTGPLSSTAKVELPHRLESVKLLPPNGQNAPHLYGLVTAQGVKVVESAVEGRRRTFAMMTTSVGKTAGLPSEWSATIDQVSFGIADKAGATQDGGALRPRLFVLAAGNVPWTAWGGYPSGNDLAPIENPGQAWNAITVGACTGLTTIDTAKWPSLSTIGEAGKLSPSSTTSLLWRSTWPFKPDVVAEGGNGCLDKSMHDQVVVGPESLRLLTTSHDVAKALLAEAGDTSAAAAEVARICGHLQARYPDYWPETVRALVVHGARLTPAMRAQLPLVPLKKDKQNLLRRYGYGRVSLEASLNSTSKRPTLVLQETITPYVKDGSDISLGKLNMHALPWPVAELTQLGAASVALRVTLSYFVEPNPSRRGWQSKFRYQSHGLRFAVKGSTETDARFRQRINQLERDALGEDGKESMSDPDGGSWFLGAQLRGRGSVHSDVWFGSAIQLAEKSHIAVYPVGGWWKDWKEGGKHSVPVRYALTVTLDVLEDIDIDVYTPIANAIAVAVPGVG